MDEGQQHELRWYEEVFESQDIATPGDELPPHLNVDIHPRWMINVQAELIRQAMPLTPVKSLAVPTPEKVGALLGQKVASMYTLGNLFQSIQSKLEEPETDQNMEAFWKGLKAQKDLPGVTSLLQTLSMTGESLNELEKVLEGFEQSVHKAFKLALDQPNYDEAVEFFRGFSKGLSRPGLVAGRLRASTDATQIYSKMYFHWQEVDRLRTVSELYGFLLKNGLTPQTLGDPERLKKLCQRIKYAPGKRGRPPASKK